jgi:hypothetical protein
MFLATYLDHVQNLLIKKIIGQIVIIVNFKKHIV